MEAILFYGTMFLMLIILISFTVASIIFLVRKILGHNKKHRQ